MFHNPILTFIKGTPYIIQGRKKNKITWAQIKNLFSLLFNLFPYLREIVATMYQFIPQIVTMVEHGRAQHGRDSLKTLLRLN